jgi:glutaredoxin 3
VKISLKSALVNTALTILTVVAAVAIGSQLPHLVQQWRGQTRTGDFSAHIAKLPQPVTLYGTSTCPHCQAARAYLTKAGIAFNDQLIDQSQSAREQYSKLDESGVPVLVSQSKLIVGFNAKAYDELLKPASPN